MSPPKAAIVLDGVAKRYTKVEERSLVSALVRRRRRAQAGSRSVLWALDDVSFAIGRGETVGVIGGNGAGKSTLLRILAAVSQPSRGSITIAGRVAPLLSVGVGFHHEMTGRENVFINGMLLGLTKRQVAERFEAIVDFAELHEFIDVPVKFYSSGMFMRLGFSVAVHVDPDIMLVDEVLAVGDASFQLRCLNRLRELTQAGTTTVFVSHSMHAVQMLCSRSMVLHRGRVEFDGPTELAVAKYHQFTSASHGPDPSGSVEVLQRQMVGADGSDAEVVTQNQHLTYMTRLRFHNPVEGPGIRFRLMAGDGTLAYSMQSPIGDRWRHYGAGDEATVRVDFAARLGGGGTFHINLDITDSEGDLIAMDTAGPSFFVAPLLGVAGPADLSAQIAVDGVGRSTHFWTPLDGGANL